VRQLKSAAAPLCITDCGARATRVAPGAPHHASGSMGNRPRRATHGELKLVRYLLIAIVSLSGVVVAGQTAEPALRCRVDRGAAPEVLATSTGATMPVTTQARRQHSHRRWAGEVTSSTRRARASMATISMTGCPPNRSSRITTSRPSLDRLNRIDTER